MRLLVSLFAACFIAGCTFSQPVEDVSEPVPTVRWRIDEKKVRSFGDLQNLIKLFEIEIEHPAGDAAWETRLKPGKKFLRRIE